MSALLESINELHESLGVEPDESGLKASLLEQVIVGQQATLWLDIAARTVRFGEQLVDLSRRRSLWLIAEHLCTTHERDSRHVCTVDELREVGWPNEGMATTAGRSRAYVAISTLRKLGLGDALEKLDAGYRLLPSLRVTRGSAPRP